MATQRIPGRRGSMGGSRVRELAAGADAAGDCLAALGLPARHAARAMALASAWAIARDHGRRMRIEDALARESVRARLDARAALGLERATPEQQAYDARIASRIASPSVNRDHLR